MYRGGLRVRPHDITPATGGAYAFVPGAVDV
jgi:hypothetical protein